jgi:hypothetical protein
MAARGEALLLRGIDVIKSGSVASLRQIDVIADQNDVIRDHIHSTSGRTDSESWQTIEIG